MSPAYLKRVRERGRNAEVIHGKCYVIANLIQSTEGGGDGSRKHVLSSMSRGEISERTRRT